MKWMPRNLVVPAIALVVLVLIVQQTLGALRASGSWQPQIRAPRVHVEDPYTRVDDLFAQDRSSLSADQVRNPFAFGSLRPVPVAGGPVKHATPSTPPMPPLASRSFR